MRFVKKLYTHPWMGGGEHCEPQVEQDRALAERYEQKAGQIDRKVELDGLSARRVRSMDASNQAFCGSNKRKEGARRPPLLHFEQCTFIQRYD